MSEMNKNLRMLRPLWTGLPVILLSTGLSLVAAWQYLHYTTPLYESTAKIKLADVNEGAINTTLIKNLDAFSGDNRTSAEMELVHSPLLVGRTLNRLRFDLSTYRVGKLRMAEMYDASPFLATVTLREPKWAERPFDLRIDEAGGLKLTAPSGEVAQGQLGQVLRLAGANVLISRNEELLKARPTLPLADHYRLVQHSRAQLLEDVTARLDVTTTDHNVPVLRISFMSPVPQKAADMVNALTAVYLEDYLATKYKVVNATSQTIEEQLKSVRRTLAHSEDSVELYRGVKRIVNIKQETETDLHKISELKIQRSSLQMSLAAADNLYTYMTDGKKNVLELAPNFEAFNDMLSTEIIKKIKDLQAEKHDLLLRFTPEDDQVKTVDLKLADLNGYLLEGVRNTRNNLRVRYKNIDHTIQESEGAFVGLPTREKGLAILQRDFVLNEKLYTFLREKGTEAEIAKATPTSYHRVIADGLVPTEPTTPKRGFVLIVSGFLGLLGGTLLVYLFSMMRSTPGDSSGLQGETSTPLAAAIPYLGTDLAGRLAFFKQLATRLALKGLLNPGTKLVITAFTDKEGQAFFFEYLRLALLTRGIKMRALVLHDAQSPNPSAQPDELLLVQNLTLTQDSHALAVMTSAQVNLFVIDGRATPSARLTELELLVEEYKLPNVQLCLNRDGYEPGMFRLMMMQLRRWGSRRTPRAEAESVTNHLPAGLDLQA